MKSDIRVTATPHGHGTVIAIRGSFVSGKPVVTTPLGQGSSIAPACGA